MNKDVRDTVIVAAAALTLVTVVFSGLYIHSGHWPPFSVVESGSMQHGTESSIGTIDTGDMVVVRVKDGVDIQSYVEGYVSGHSMFGEYGDVIVYERGGGRNPVIHRPIVWLDWNGSSWDAPTLKDFPGWSAGAKSHANGDDGTGLTGKLTLTGIGYLNKEVELNLDTLVKRSGYATMGDSEKNMRLDQTGGIVDSLVSEDMILYVASFEIPWIGCIKLYVNGTNIEQIPPNSVLSMVFAAVGTLAAVVALFAVADYVSWYRGRRE